MRSIAAAVLSGMAMTAIAQNQPILDPALAEIELPPRYQVELVVFMNLRPSPGNESFAPRSDPLAWESFDDELEDDAETAGDEEDGLVSLDDVIDDETEVEIIRRRPTEIVTDPAQWDLQGISNRIKTSRDYRLLSHQVWQQDGLAADDANPFVIRTQDTEDGRLDGSALLSIGRFPHLKLDLNWLPGENKRDLPLYPRLNDLRNMPTPYQMSQSRRVTRTGEAHYFDHPYFGAIAVVSVVEEPDIDEFGNPLDASEAVTGNRR